MQIRCIEKCRKGNAKMHLDEESEENTEQDAIQSFIVNELLLIMLIKSLNFYSNLKMMKNDVIKFKAKTTGKV